MNNNILRIKFYSFDHKVLDDFIKSFTFILREQKVEFKGPILLPVKINKITLLSSVHIYKKSKEHFEMRIYKRILDILELNFSSSTFNSVELPNEIKFDIQRIIKGTQ